MRLNHVFLCCMLFAAYGLSGCKKKQHSDEFVLKFWNVRLNATNVVPALPGNGSSAYATLYLRDDYRLYYDIYFDSLAGLTPETVEIRMGNPLQNGNAAVLQLSGNFTGSKMKGDVAMPKEVADSLLKNPGYLVIASKTAPGGLVRGQLDRKILLAKDVSLTGDQVQPPVNTAATAKIYLRMTDDNTLFYAIDVKDLPANDQLMEAHVHNAGGSVLLKLATTATDYTQPLNTSVTGEALRALQQDPLYLDIHSTLAPAGLLRGTLR
ncbi:CHRD domain-containing protein [Chitinophaga sp. RAB17]|uniref:CHRD domain-containing protein n=1 Tax=Chitinophaga sp. RAB17 TaxID=3233049 RepID=UPI003F8F5789